MKKLKYLLLVSLVSVGLLAGCGKDEQPANPGVSGNVTPGGDTIEIIDFDDIDGTVDEQEYEEETREGMVRSNLTNEWIDEELANQRPIAVMVDNEVTALDHYGVNDADIVYEMVNSTANGWVTRLMVIMKDWDDIEQLGSIRSARPTNFMMANEYDAILIHDGGPIYITTFVANELTNNLSGGFARFSNGKATEYTEYVTSESYTNPNTGNTYKGLIQRIQDAGYSTTYRASYQGDHFVFSKDPDYKLSSRYTDTQSAVSITPPFTHNGSNLVYNEATGTYDYYEYSRAHIDPLDNDNILTFKNVIIMEAEVYTFDDHGYMIYQIQNVTGSGYYITNGEAIPITWDKQGEYGMTHFNDCNGNPIELNTGKTYICLSPNNHGELVIE